MNTTERHNETVEITKGIKTISFDYENQAWVINGRYVRCGHPDHMNCQCYGKVHEGEYK
jgi:hypothetical protein